VIPPATSAVTAAMAATLNVGQPYLQRPRATSCAALYPGGGSRSRLTRLTSAARWVVAVATADTDRIPETLRCSHAPWLRFACRAELRLSPPPWRFLRAPRSSPISRVGSPRKLFTYDLTPSLTAEQMRAPAATHP
jgi:hypothetical protein